MKKLSLSAVLGFNLKLLHVQVDVVSGSKQEHICSGDKYRFEFQNQTLRCSQQYKAGEGAWKEIAWEHVPEIIRDVSARFMMESVKAHQAFADYVLNHQEAGRLTTIDKLVED